MTSWKSVYNDDDQKTGKFEHFWHKLINAKVVCINFENSPNDFIAMINAVLAEPLLIGMAPQISGEQYCE